MNIPAFVLVPLWTGTRFQKFLLGAIIVGWIVAMITINERNEESVRKLLILFALACIVVGALARYYRIV